MNKSPFPLVFTSDRKRSPRKAMFQVQGTFHNHSAVFQRKISNTNLFGFKRFQNTLGHEIGNNPAMR